MKKKIIITGAAGEVGLNLLSLIDRNKYNIIAIDYNSNNISICKKLFPEVDIRCIDLSIDYTTWNSVFADADIVIQLHAQISSPEWTKYYKNNVIAVKNIIKACEDHKVKHLIHASSSVVCSLAKDGYTKSKSIGEELVKTSKISYTILRPTLMYGCFDIKHLGFLTKIINMSPIFPVPGSGKYIRQPLFVEDFANIIIKLINMKPQNKIYNISGKEKLYFIDLLKEIAHASKKTRIFLRIPIPIFSFLLRVYSFLFRIHYIPDQLNAMTAGDVFEIIHWEEIFHVPYTSYKKGIRKMLNSKYYSYASKMKL